MSLKKKELKQYKSCIPENRKGGKYGEKKMNEAKIWPPDTVAFTKQFFLGGISCIYRTLYFSYCYFFQKLFFMLFLEQEYL